MKRQGERPKSASPISALASIAILRPNFIPREVYKRLICSSTLNKTLFAGTLRQIRAGETQVDPQSCAKGHAELRSNLQRICHCPVAQGATPLPRSRTLPATRMPLTGKRDTWSVREQSRGDSIADAAGEQRLFANHGRATLSSQDHCNRTDSDCRQQPFLSFRTSKTAFDSTSGSAI